jgi:large subunit ribosomal protein L25
MQLIAYECKPERKSDTKKFRREHKIPAILYFEKEQNKQLLLEGAAFEAILRKMGTGYLGTTIFDLKIDGKSTKAIIKDIQYQLTTYKVLHIDFEPLLEGKLVTVKVPIKCVGMASCPGIKLGGVLRQVLRHIKVRCLPKDIPQEFFIDVQHLGIAQSKNVSDLECSSLIKLIAKMDQVVVVISKRSK